MANGRKHGDRQEQDGAGSDDSGSATTAVGRRPAARRRRRLVGVPVGIEKVLYAAAADPAFRQALMRNRQAA